MNSNIAERKSFYTTALDHIESVVEGLSYNITFDKSNLNSHVHSSQIADIILQCASYIESISKDLFIDYDFNDKNTPRWKLKYDNCLRAIIQAWGLEQRALPFAPSIIGLQGIQFRPLKFNSKTKFNNELVSTWRWNKVYQAIKHDLVSSQHEATIGMLLNILSVLVLLTTYYCDPICASSFLLFTEHAAIPTVSRLFRPLFADIKAVNSRLSIGKATFLILRQRYADYSRLGHNIITVLNKNNETQVNDRVIERLKEDDYEN